MSPDPEGLALGLFGANVGYIMGMLIISELYQISVSVLVGGALEGSLGTLISAWIAVGALLTVADFAAIFGGIIALVNTGR